MTDRKHFPAIADSARAVLQSLNAFIKAKRDCKATLLSDELLHEFMVRRRALRQRMIDAGCFEEKERVQVFPLGGPAHAALLTLSADLAGSDDRLPQEIEVFASRLSAVVDALTAADTPPAVSTATVEEKEIPWESNPAWEDLALQQKRVLRFMHGKESVSIEDFAREVWGDANRKDGTIRTALSRTNQFLRLVGERRILAILRGEPVVRWE
jgi:hypothetical protein